MLDKEKYREYIDNLTNYKIGKFRLRLTDEKICIILWIARDTLYKIRNGLVPWDKVKIKIMEGYDDFTKQFYS
jgi:hypothetical protein